MITIFIRGCPPCKKCVVHYITEQGTGDWGYYWTLDNGHLYIYEQEIYKSNILKVYQTTRFCIVYILVLSFPPSQSCKM